MTYHTSGGQRRYGSSAHSSSQAQKPRQASGEAGCSGQNVICGRRADTPDLAVAGLELRLTVQPDPTTRVGSTGGPISPATRGERKVIVILTNPALIDRISPNSRRVEILQDDMSTMSANKIVATGARHSSFRTEN